MEENHLAGVHPPNPKNLDNRPNSQHQAVKGTVSVNEQEASSKKNDLLNGNVSSSEEELDSSEEEEATADTSLLQQAVQNEPKGFDTVENDENANIQAGKGSSVSEDVDEATNLINSQKKLKKRLSTIEREKHDRSAAWFEAAATSDLDTIEWLLDSGLDVNIANEVQHL